MEDQIDRANALAEKEREVLIANHLRKQPACSSTFCETCGEAIPLARQKMVIGCSRCVDCQTLYEHKMKGYRRC